MKEELYEILFGVYEYIHKVAEFVKPVLALLLSAISYVLFPDQAYVAPTIGLLGALILDVGTKYYSISRRNGGFKNSIKTHKISSGSMWMGTKKKLVSIIVVMICCGLLMRFTTFLPQIAITITTISFLFMFLREVQSIIENLIDAGHDDLKWFLVLIKKKQKEVLDIDEVEVSKNVTETKPTNDEPTI